MRSFDARVTAMFYQFVPSTINPAHSDKVDYWVENPIKYVGPCSIPMSNYLCLLSKIESPLTILLTTGFWHWRLI